MSMRFHLMFGLAGAFLLGAVAGGAFPVTVSFAQGYDGLISPGDAPSSTKKDEPPGYRGLIPGAVPEEHETPEPPAPHKAPRPHKPQPQAEAAPPASPPQMTYAPGYVPRKIQTADDLRMAAMITPKGGFKPEAFPPGVADKMLAVFTPEMKQALAVPQMRIAGMLPREYGMKSSIDAMVASATNPAIPEAQRRENARKAYARLALIARTMRAQQDMSGWIYAKMGAPANFAHDMDETTQHVLERAESALRDLQHYQ